MNKLCLNLLLLVFSSTVFGQSSENINEEDGEFIPVDPHSYYFEFASDEFDVINLDDVEIFHELDFAEEGSGGINDLDTDELVSPEPQSLRIRRWSRTFNADGAYPKVARTPNWKAWKQRWYSASVFIYEDYVKLTSIAEVASRVGRGRKSHTLVGIKLYSGTPGNYNVVFEGQGSRFCTKGGSFGNKKVKINKIPLPVGIETTEITAVRFIIRAYKNCSRGGSKQSPQPTSPIYERYIVRHECVDESGDIYGYCKVTMPGESCGIAKKKYSDLIKANDPCYKCGIYVYPGRRTIDKNVQAGSCR